MHMNAFFTWLAANKLIAAFVLVIVLGGGTAIVANKQSDRDRQGAETDAELTEEQKKARYEALNGQPTEASSAAAVASSPASGSTQTQTKATTSPKSAATASSTSSSTSQSSSTSTKTSDQPRIQHIGVNLGTFDPSTGMAGDFKFTKATLHENRLWMDYGYTINNTNTGTSKRNPQPTFILPLGTKVYSLVDGKVTNVQKLYSNDYTIMVQRTDNDKYTYETEHVINPSVKVGDTVKAGQAIAEVSNHDSHYNEGMGLVEIGILAPSSSEPQHICPFNYLDPSIKSDMQSKITAFYKAWEEYRGADLYDDGSYPVPGCQLLDPIAG
jgi:hypothetical protein